MKRIISGIKKFQSEVFPQKRELFEKLARNQKPEALVISCADSRVDMQLVTQSEPGQLFFFRNAGNIIPPYGAALGAVSATIEFAMVALKVPHIIVCGHSDCGAMKGILHPEAVAEMPTVKQWLQHSDSARQVVARAKGLDESQTLDLLIRENVLSQIDNLRTHPSVAVALANGEVELHGWFYDIPRGDVSAYDSEAGRFVSLDGESPRGVSGRKPVRLETK